MENMVEKNAKAKIAAAKEKWGERFCEYPTQERIAQDAKLLERIAFELKDRAETILFWLERNNVNAETYTRLFRGDVTGTALGGTDGAVAYDATGTFIYMPTTLVFLDSPATTSATSYTLGLRTQAGIAAIRVQQTMNLLEVAG
jgi:hypothetical protein